MLTRPPESVSAPRKKMLMSRDETVRGALKDARDCAPVLDNTVDRAMSLIAELASAIPPLEVWNEEESANVNPVAVRDIAS